MTDNPWSDLDSSTRPDSSGRVDDAHETYEAEPVCPECGSARIYREGDMVYREVPSKAQFGPHGYEKVTEREASTEMGYRTGSIAWTCSVCDAEFDAPAPSDD